MMQRLFQQLKLRAPAMRQGIAILCTVAIVVIGFTHALHHSGTVFTAAMETSLSSGGDETDVSKPVAVVSDHCFGCTMIVASTFSPSLSPELVESDLPIATVADYRPYIPLAEPPPPKTLI